MLAWLWGPGLAGVLNFGVMAIVLGALFAINSWDWPTYFGVTGGAALIALLLSRKAPRASVDGVEEVDERESEAAESRLGRAGAWALALVTLVSVIALGLVSLLAYLPFFLTFKAFYTKIMPLVDGGLIENTNTVMHRTTLQEYVVVWAIFVFISVSYLVVRLWNFPWSAAFADLINLMPGGANTTVRPSVVSTQALTAEQIVPQRRLQRLDLAPSYAGASSSTMLSFARTTEDDLPPSGPLGFGQRAGGRRLGRHGWRYGTRSRQRLPQDCRRQRFVRFQPGGHTIRWGRNGRVPNHRARRRRLDPRSVG